MGVLGSSFLPSPTLCPDWQKCCYTFDSLLTCPVYANAGRAHEQTRRRMSLVASGCAGMANPPHPHPHPVPVPSDLHPQIPYAQDSSPQDCRHPLCKHVKHFKHPKHHPSPNLSRTPAYRIPPQNPNQIQRQTGTGTQGATEDCPPWQTRRKHHKDPRFPMEGTAGGQPSGSPMA
jgi:hypothetical protein